jgi:hypothetical protein
MVGICFKNTVRYLHPGSLMIGGRFIRLLQDIFRDVMSRQIYLRELDSENDNASSDDSVSSEDIINMDQMIEDLKPQIDGNEQKIKKHKQQIAASKQ